MKNKSVELPFITKNSKHLVRTICSHMKNKSVKLPFATKTRINLVPRVSHERESLREFYRGYFCLGNPRFDTLAYIRVVYINKFFARHENLFYRKYSLEKKQQPITNY